MKLTENFEDWDGDEELYNAVNAMAKSWLSHKKKYWTIGERNLLSTINKFRRSINLENLK